MLSVLLSASKCLLMNRSRLLLGAGAYTSTGRKFVPQANVHISEMYLISNVIPGIRCIVALIAAHCLFFPGTRECVGLHVWVCID